MGQVTMQIKCRAHSAPEKERQHDRQIGKLEARQEPDHSEQLQCDQDNENEKIKFFVLKHAARWSENEAANRPRLNPDARVSHDNGGATNRYFGGGQRCWFWGFAKASFGGARCWLRRQVDRRMQITLDQTPPQKRLARNHMFHVYVLMSATIRRRYVG